MLRFFAALCRRREGTIVVLACAAVGVFTAWARLGRSIPLADATTLRIPCLSYSVHSGTESPADPAFTPSSERIAQDLDTLSTLSRCVRLYAVAQGGDQIVAEAEKRGMTVILGGWISADADGNQDEIERLIALANAYPQTVAAVVVGNETLLRQEMAPDRLAALIRTVSAQVRQPVSYADVWGVWLRFQDVLAPAVDFATIHILPYWEDDPVPENAALAYVASILEHVRASLSGKDVLIGETGWPSRGRQRQGAEPSLVGQTRFLRALTDKAADEGWPLNVIEAFDQPWKRSLEGTVGGAWGLFDQTRRPKVTLSGPVSERPDWAVWSAASALLGLATALAALGAGRRRPDGGGWAVLVFGGMTAGGVLGFVASHAWESSRTPLEWGINGAVWVLAAFSAVEILAALHPRIPPPAPRFALLRRAALAVAAASALGLLFDPRYRDFPAFMLAVAAAGTWLLILRQGRAKTLKNTRREDVWLAVVVMIGALAVLFQEGPANDDALAWVVTAAALALPSLCLPFPRLSAPKPQSKESLRQQPHPHCKTSAR